MKIKMDKFKKLAVTIALFLSIAVIVMGVMPAVAAADDVAVIRKLPEEVAPGDEFVVELTQSGFYMDTGIVGETLPDGFEYVHGSFTGSADAPPYSGNNLIIEFREETIITYNATAGTAEQIEDAVFSGTYKAADKDAELIIGNVTGDTTLTLAEGPKPTPTPTSTPGNGNGGGGDGIPSTPPAGTPACIALDANPADIPADGVSTSTITASVWDGEDRVLENLTVNFSTSSGSITASAVIANGTATAILTAGMEEGVATITAEANLSGDIGIVTNTTAVNFTAPVATPTPAVNVTLTPTPSVTVSPTPTATPSPTPSPTKKPLIPGFEAGFAIASLLSVMYLVLRGRKRE